MRLIILFAFGLIPTALLAQNPRERPPLPAGADENDAAEYMRLGDRLLESNPGRAEQAFAWASRLAPGWAEAMYGQYAARLLARKDLLVRWMQADQRVMRAKDMVNLDSLRWSFYTADPFLFGQYDRTLLMAYFNELIDRNLRAVGGLNSVDRAAIDYELQLYLRGMGAEMNGWLAYTERRFPDALSYYANGLKQTKDKAALHANRALVHYHTGNYEEAVAELSHAVEERSSDDKDKLIHIYQSQATYEFMIGRAHEARSDTASAREAYARALLSDLSYYPAHLRLGRIDLAAGDTAAALNAFRTAVDLRPNDAAIRWLHGNLLLEAGQPAQARPELRQATMLEPFFAAPYFALGRIAEISNNRAEAVNWYRQFLERASQRDSARPLAEARLRELGS